MKEETEDFFEEMEKSQIKELTDVGFTEEQARVLLKLMQGKALFGGFL